MAFSWCGLKKPINYSAQFNSVFMNIKYQNGDFGTAIGFDFTVE